jgi:hypothetical protein
MWAKDLLELLDRLINTLSKLIFVGCIPVAVEDLAL